LVLDTGPQTSQPIESRIRPSGAIFTKGGGRLVGPWKNIAEREGEIRLAPLNEDPSCLLRWRISGLDPAPAEVQVAKERIFLLPLPPPLEQAEVLVDADKIWKPLEDTIFNSPRFERLLATRIEAEIRKRALEIAARTDEVSVALLRNAEVEVETLSSRAHALRTEVAELESQLSSLAASVPLQHVRRRWPRTEPPAKDLKHWVEASLTGQLGWYVPSVSYDDAEEVAVAYLGCHCLLVPDPGYAVAFCQASGGAAELLLVPVEPHWIRWQDCWAPEVAGLWEAATQNPNTMYLLHFQDLDRSLSGLWGTPFWNLACGLADSLPDTRFLGWPPNLRLSASVARDEASFPLAESLLRHFGATLPRTEPAGRVRARSSPLQLPGVAWATSATPVELHEEVAGFGSAARQAALEIGRLEQLFSACGSSAHEATRRALRVRVSAPRRLKAQDRPGAH
jgi:hypothetical protein